MRAVMPIPIPQLYHSMPGICYIEFYTSMTLSGSFLLALIKRSIGVRRYRQACPRPASILLSVPHIVNNASRHAAHSK